MNTCDFLFNQTGFLTPYSHKEITTLESINLGMGIFFFWCCHAGITLQFSMDTFSFSESDGSGYVEVTASSAPASDFMFNFSQGELGLSQSLSSLPAWTLATYSSCSCHL